MTLTRSYQSPLRAEQMEQTRVRILEAVLELSQDPTSGGLTVAAAAERARVSVRTAYRYFPTLEALMDAFHVWLWGKLGTVDVPTELADVPAFIPHLFVYYERNTPFFRAGRANATGASVGGQLRARRKAQQMKSMRTLLAPLTAKLAEDETRKLGAMLHTFFSLESYWILTDVWGLTREQAADATVVAIERLLAPLSSGRSPKTKTKKT